MRYNRARRSLDRHATDSCPHSSPELPEWPDRFDPPQPHAKPGNRVAHSAGSAARGIPSASSEVWALFGDRWWPSSRKGPNPMFVRDWTQSQMPASER